MSELERQGKLVLGGPLVASFERMRPTGAVMVLRAETEEEVRALLAADPSGLLSIQEVRPFVLSGGTALKPWLSGRARTHPGCTSRAARARPSRGVAVQDLAAYGRAATFSSKSLSSCS
jgi:hypothetical protein